MLTLLLLFWIIIYLSPFSVHLEYFGKNKLDFNTKRSEYFSFSYCWRVVAHVYNKIKVTSSRILLTEVERLIHNYLWPFLAESVLRVSSRQNINPSPLKVKTNYILALKTAHLSEGWNLFFLNSSVARFLFD